MRHALTVLALSLGLYLLWQVVPDEERSQIRALLKRFAFPIFSLIALVFVALGLAYYVTAAKIL